VREFKVLYTIEKKIESEIKIKRSRFVAGLYPLSAKEEVKEILNAHNCLFADATHNCYAYLYGLHREISYYSDAGEPSGTAGKPILNTLLRNDLTNVLAIVSRYFGGVKLGVKGLIAAYSDAVEQAILQSYLIEAKQLISYPLVCDYASFEGLKHSFQEIGGEIEQVTWSEEISFMLSLPIEQETEFRKIMAGNKHKIRLNYQ